MRSPALVTSRVFLSLWVLALGASAAHAEEDFYTGAAGKNRPDGIGGRDGFGNASGSEFDLGKDGAFKGQNIAVLQLYVDSQFGFAEPTAALREKGFEIIHWKGQAPDVATMKAGLQRSSQLWVISNASSNLSGEHIEVIKDFFHSGRGLFIWGDNDPLNTDANALAQPLFGATLRGNYHGGQIVGVQTELGKAGIVEDHLLSTGLENVFEGVTIASIHDAHQLEPLLYSSDNSLAAAFYDKGGKRAIVDGAYTRLYVNWHTAGTNRYVKNAAAWLANTERTRRGASAARAPSAPARK